MGYKCIDNSDSVMKRLKSRYMKKYVPANLKYNKKCVFVSGSPGSGKSTYMLSKMKEGYAVLDYDQLMFMHPTWRSNAKVVNKNIFDSFSDCVAAKVRVVFNDIKAELLKKNANVLVQVNAPYDILNANKTCVDNKYYFDGKMYKSMLTLIHTPLEVAIKRKNIRHEKIGFMFPTEDLVYNYLIILSQIGFITQRKLVKVNVYDGNPSPASKIEDWRVISNATGMRFEGK